MYKIAVSDFSGMVFIAGRWWGLRRKVINYSKFDNTFNDWYMTEGLDIGN